ncbi:hypothetical protein [Rhizohabitans arisaemae]|uniref:hypothetical protein n=1 Tax=Rhizohabitans arisaemae TaxID=2720610 RepID=UPI0024B26575|nr:hypothetical protein [Rhizohabitans arisaemae]
MGNVVDYVKAESLDRGAQQLTQAELERLEELLSPMTGDGGYRSPENVPVHGRRA